MAKASPIINALNAGEWSRVLDGRTDIQGYPASASVMENFIPMVQGPALRRAGSAFVRSAKFGQTNPIRLVPFSKSSGDSYVIEFGENYCRFYTDRAPVVTGVTTAITGASATNPVVITTAGHSYLKNTEVFLTGISGMTELNNRWFVIDNVTATTFELYTIHKESVDGTGYTAYTSGGTIDTPYEIVSPYGASQLNDSFGLDYVQSGDVLYLTDRAGLLPPKKLSRTAPTSWAFSDVDPDEGPWLDLNATATTIYASAATGTITLTASASIFTADDVGSIIRLDQEVITATPAWQASTAYVINDYVRSEGKEYQAASAGTTGTSISIFISGTENTTRPTETSRSGTSGTSIPAHTSGTVSDGGVDWTYTSPGYGVARITAQAGTTATATVITRFPQTLVGSGNATTFWRKGAWSEAAGYPTCVTFFRERLVYGKGQTIYASVAGDFENFAIDSFGEILTESAITTTVQGSEANDIVNLSEGRALVVNTTGSEFVVDVQSSTAPLGPNNIKVTKQTGYGAAPIRGITVGENTLFVQASQGKIRAARYEFQVDNYIATDQTVRARDILVGGIVQMAYQEEPHQSLWAARADGTLLSFSYDETQEVRGWARHVLGGTASGSSIDGVKSVAVIPSPDGSRSDVWVAVDRSINGGFRQYIEYLQPEYDVLQQQLPTEVTYADSMLSYSFGLGNGVTTLYGLDHLEGETVGVLADGAVAPDAVVSNGEITLSASAETIQVGYRYASIYQTNRLDAGGAEGTAQGKTKRITDCWFRVVDTLGGTAGPDAANQDDIAGLMYRAPATPMDGPPDFVTGDVSLSWPGGYETDAYIRYENDSMFPATIAAIMPQVVTQESR